MGTKFGIAVVLLVASGAWVWSTRAPGSEPSGRGGQGKGTLHLETFVLNLADPGQRSYLRVGIDLGLAREIGRGETAPVGQVRDTILGVLAESKVDDLTTLKGKTKLKDDLLRALQERVPGLAIEEVYFTEFLIQR
jgi:flagellar FliL protein